MSAVVSVRVKKRVKEILEEAGVDIAGEVRRYLEELARKVKAKELVAKWDELLADVKPSARGFSVRSVREDRDSR